MEQSTVQYAVTKLQLRARSLVHQGATNFLELKPVLESKIESSEFSSNVCGNIPDLHQLPSLMIQMANPGSITFSYKQPGLGNNVCK
jgi:hypothetical protein